MIYKKIILNEYYDNCKDGYLELYLLEDNTPKQTILICPGGGYAYVSPREGECIALRINQMGYNAAILTYTTGYNCYPYPMNELEDAIHYLYNNKEVYNVSSISLMGFSAGGHLAAYVGYTTKQKISSIILGYPVITFGKYTHLGSKTNLLGNENKFYEEFSVETLINGNSPRTFIFTTVSDETVPFENTLLLINELRKNNVSLELHAYESGVHGMSLGTKEAGIEPFKENEVFATWTYFLEEFLKRGC